MYTIKSLKELKIICFVIRSDGTKVGDKFDLG